MAKIHPSATVDKGAHLEQDVVVGPNCVIENGASIGAGTVLDANVVIAGCVTLGKANQLFANCVIGRCPQILGFGMSSKTGRVIIGDGNTIRENVTIHPSRYDDSATTIGDDNLMMVGVHIGHDCTVESKIVLSNSVQIGGHCRIETGAWLAGMVGVHQFVTIGKWSFAAGLAGITRDVPPFLIVSGHFPPTIRGTNRRGMSRAGLSEQQQEQIQQAYRQLYRQGGPLLENARVLAQQDQLDPNVLAIIDSIEKSAQHRFGRYLETLRKSS
jgi:UDP-N-acetylglucosamine acyltransferase